ncbi:MAG: NAD(P)/FAD-dependent oxidoreductase [Cyclobacteriaceae bacterium]
MNVIIIGGGLSGLVLANHLRNNGISFTIFEARARPGGRIHTFADDKTQVELGATWFSDQHLQLKSLLSELGLSDFPQFQDGKAIFEATSMAPVQIFDLPKGQPSSYRISGGTSRLIDALLRAIPADSVLFKSEVAEIRESTKGLSVSLANGKTYESHLVVSTLPPALLATDIRLPADFPDQMKLLCSQTHTWMGNSIKFAVSYERPFWRESGFAGVGFSNAGVASEIHDHVNDAGDKYALKGFLVPGAIRLSHTDRKQRVIDQLIRFFGERAGKLVSYHETLWAEEKYTSGLASNDLIPHQNNGHPAFASPVLNGKMLISGSETSPNHGGYMEGAVYAAKSAFEWVLSNRQD